MPASSLEDVFQEGYLSPKAKTKVKPDSPVDKWKNLYREVYSIDFERMGDANLYSACCELQRFCKANQISFAEYAKWCMENLGEVFSPRRITNDKFLNAFKNSLIPEAVSGGFFILETKEVVQMVFQKDGQIVLDLPPDGEVYLNGTAVHAMRV